MISDWLRSVLLVSFAAGAATAITDGQYKERFSRPIRFIASLVMILVILRPMFAAFDGIGDYLGGLFSPSGLQELSDSDGGEYGGFAVDTALWQVETGIKSNIAYRIGRDDFDIELVCDSSGDTFTVQKVLILYEKEDFPTLEAERCVEDLLKTEAETVKKDGEEKDFSD